MLFAILVLSPTVLAILAAVCSVRLGICALHGQVLYFIALFLYSVMPLTVNSLWIVPMAACFMFLCGTLAACFMVKKDLFASESRRGIAFTVLIAGLNLALLVLLLETALDIMCLRLDSSMDVPGVATLALMAKAGSGALLFWMLLWSILGKRRLGQSAFYALCGLLIGSYLVLAANAGPDGSFMPAPVVQALSLREPLAYYSVMPDARISGGIILLPPIIAMLCAALGASLLQKGKTGKK